METQDRTDLTSILKERIAALETERTSLTEALLAESGEKAAARAEVEMLRELVKKHEAAVADSERRLKNEIAWSVQRRHDDELLNAAIKTLRTALEKATKTIAGLERERQDLRKEIAALKKKSEASEKSYRKLAKSKLGRLTLSYWRLKDGLKKSRVKK